MFILQYLLRTKNTKRLPILPMVYGNAQLSHSKLPLFLDGLGPFHLLLPRLIELCNESLSFLREEEEEKGMDRGSMS